MSYMERFLRRFMGIVKDMEKDSGEDACQAQSAKNLSTVHRGNPAHSLCSLKTADIAA